jgi:pseudo-rSAM protein
MEKTDYWFYLEPYVFIFRDDSKYVIYNTLNSAYIDCSIFNSVDKLLQELYTSEKNYCVGISKKQFMDESFLVFFNHVRDTFSGDIVENKGQSPFIFKPVLKIYYHPVKSKTKEDNLLGLNSLLYLHEVSFYLENQENMNEYRDCYRQFLYPAITGQQLLTFQNYETIIKQLSICQLDKINIITHDPKNNSLLKDISHLINDCNLKAEFIVPYKNYLINDIDDFFLNQKLIFKIMIHLPVDIKKLEQQMRLFSKHNIIWTFLVAEEAHVESIECIENTNIRIEFLPWYNGNNQIFFRNRVFNTFNDITGVSINKQKIFRRQVLNENFFGKLTIFPDGKVYSNVNFPYIGNILEQKITQIVYNEINNPSSAWFITRDIPSCKQCVNKYLCPSISNYEIVTNEYNMCYLNDKSI